MLIAFPVFNENQISAFRFTVFYFCFSQSCAQCFDFMQLCSSHTLSRVDLSVLLFPTSSAIPVHVDTASDHISQLNLFMLAEYHFGTFVVIWGVFSMHLDIVARVARVPGGFWAQTEEFDYRLTKSSKRMWVSFVSRNTKTLLVSRYCIRAQLRSNFRTTDFYICASQFMSQVHT